MEDSAVMNNIITDIKEGFVQRRLPDGGFKVKIFKRVYLRGWKMDDISIFSLNFIVNFKNFEIEKKKFCMK